MIEITDDAVKDATGKACDPVAISEEDATANAFSNVC